MEDFKNTKLIYMAGLDIYQVENLKELNEILFGKAYNVLTEEEKIVKRIEKVLPLSLAKNLPLIHIKDVQEFSPQLMYSIIVDNEKMFYTSLCKNKIIDILERKDVNIFISSTLKRNNFNNFNDFKNLEIDSANIKTKTVTKYSDESKEDIDTEIDKSESNHYDKNNNNDNDKEKDDIINISLDSNTINETKEKTEEQNNEKSNRYNEYYEINEEDKNTYYKISEKAKEIIIEQILKNKR